MARSAVSENAEEIDVERNEKLDLVNERICCK